MPQIWMDVDTAIAEAPINLMPLIDDTDFKTIEDAVVYNAAGMALIWHFVTTAGVMTETAVTPTTGGVHDWTDQGTSGLYALEIPASAGTINNDTEGFGWFTGVITGVLPFRGPVIGFRDAAINNLMIDDALSVTRGLAGTALPAAAADAAGGLAISDAGGLDLDSKLANTNEVTAARMAALTDWINGGRLDLLLDGIKAITDQFVFTTANQVDSNMLSISSDGPAADNLEAQFDGTGLSGDTYPSTQSQLSSIANVGSAVHKPASSYTLTTGTQSANLYTDTEALDGVRHTHTDDAGAISLEYHFLIGSGTPASVLITGYVTGGNDDIDVFAYDWVTAGYKQIGNIDGSSSTNNGVHSFDLFIDMVGKTGDLGKVDIKLEKSSGLTSATLAIDQIYLSFNQGSVGYDNGAVWIDTNFTNTNTQAGIDGVAVNPVSTIAAVNTLLLSTNLHRVEVAPASSITFAASQTDEVFKGHDWTLAFGGQDITGSHIESAICSGIATATSSYELRDCEIGAVTMDNGGEFNDCALTSTFTIGQAGVFTFHGCFNNSSSEISIDFGALGATTVHVFAFDGEINFANMAAGDFVHITGAGTITTTTCTGGTIEHDGFFEYTDSGGNVTEQQSDIKVAVDATQVNTGTDIPARFDGVEGATFDTSTDSLEAIRNRGDSAWITGGGGGITDILNIQSLIPLDIDLANTATYRLGMMLINSLDDLPTIAEIDVGTISIDRKAIGGTSWSSVVSDAACSESAGLIYYDEVFDSGTGYAEGDSIRITLKSQKITVAANDYEISDSTGRMFYTNIRQTMRGTDSANTVVPPTVAQLNARTLVAADYFDPATDPVANVTTVGTTTTNTDMRGTDSAATETKQDIIDANVDTLLGRIIGTLAAGTHNPASAAQIAVLSDWINGGRLDLILDIIAVDTTTDIPALIATAQADLDIITGADGVNLLTATQASIDAIQAAIGTAGAGLTDLGGMSTGMKAEILVEVVKVLVTQMTESYAADGVAPTMAQSLFLIQQALTEFAISGTTTTIKKLDGTITAATLTHDDATNATSATRAT